MCAPAQGVDASSGATFDPIVLHRPPTPATTTPAPTPAPTAATPAPTTLQNAKQAIAGAIAGNLPSGNLGNIIPDILNGQHSG